LPHNEGDPRDRQAILGHHSEEFTRRVYQKPIRDRQKASVNALEARLTGKVPCRQRVKSSICVPNGGE
jgi:hypothetical protein